MCAVHWGLESWSTFGVLSTLGLSGIHWGMLNTLEGYHDAVWGLS